MPFWNTARPRGRVTRARPEGVDVQFAVAYFGMTTRWRLDGDGIIGKVPLCHKDP